MKKINKKIIAIILAVILAGSGSGYLIYSYVHGNLFNPDSVSDSNDTKKNKVDFDDKVDKVDEKNEEEKKPEENKTENSQKNKDKNASPQNSIKSRGQYLRYNSRKITMLFITIFRLMFQTAQPEKAATRTLSALIQIQTV